MDLVPNLFDFFGKSRTRLSLSPCVFRAEATYRFTDVPQLSSMARANIFVAYVDVCTCLNPELRSLVLTMRPNPRGRLPPWALPVLKQSDRPKCGHSKQSVSLHDTLPGTFVGHQRGLVRFLNGELASGFQVCAWTRP